MSAKDSSTQTNALLGEDTLLEKLWVEDEDEKKSFHLFVIITR
jgi:hypothetical protein